MEAVGILRKVRDRQTNEGVEGVDVLSWKKYCGEKHSYIGCSSGESMQERLRRAAVVDVLDKRQELVPTESLFFTIAQEVQQKPKMNYNEFRTVAEKVPEFAKRFFAARSFLRFPQDDKGCIDTEDFLRHFQRSIDVETTILNLCSYSVGAAERGVILEHELEHFLSELLPKIPHLRAIHESFKPFYVYTASRRFLFFLDPKRRREINIFKLGTSAPMEELLFLQRMSQYQSEDSSEMDVAEQLSHNWFWPENALALYRAYLNLDRDRNGTITKEDLMEYQGENGGLQLTHLTVQRIFEEVVTFRVGGRLEMDYKAFLDVVLAVEHRESPQSVAFFWRILDVDRSGKLTPLTILQFYRSITVTLEDHGYAAPAEDDVIQEIYDMVGLAPRTPITLPDLMKSAQGPVVVAMLTDANSFWCYDNRENNLLQNNES